MAPEQATGLLVPGNIVYQLGVNALALFGVAVHQGGIAQQVDEPRYAARVFVNPLAGQRCKHIPPGASDDQAVLDISECFFEAEWAEVVIHRDALHELLEFGPAQGLL